MLCGGTVAMELEFPDWEEPIDEEELDAVLGAASAASSASKRQRVGYACEGHGPKPAGVHGGGDDAGSSNGVIHRSHGRRLPSWGEHTAPSAHGTAAESGAPDRGIDSADRASCGSTDGLWRALSPPSCRRVDFKFKYPLMSFGGHIVYSRTAPEVEKATLKLLEIIEAKKENLDKIPMGFDIEWRPTFRRGEALRKAAVMQICVGTSHCFVMHIIHSGIPSILKSLLEDSLYVKVGVCIANDALKILKDYSVQVVPLDDLSACANLKLGGSRKNWSLCSLTEVLTCKELAKPSKIRMGNWEVDVLSREQLHYAATDAFASWYLYEVIRSLPAASAKAEDGVCT